MNHIYTMDIILNRARANLGFTADNQLANWLGVERATVSAWRKKKGIHKPRNETLDKLASAAQVDSQDILNVIYEQKIRVLQRKIAVKVRRGKRKGKSL